MSKSNEYINLSILYLSADFCINYFYSYSKYNDSIEDASENINCELISGKLESNFTTLNTKSTQNMNDKSPLGKRLEESKIPLENIDECLEEGKLFSYVTI